MHLHRPTKRHQSGFSVIEVLLVFLVVAVLAVTSLVVYQRHKSISAKNSAATGLTQTTTPLKTTATPTTPAQPVDPYAGWKSYTLTYEKLTFKYPSNWTVSDQSTATARHDEVTLNAPDNFSYYFNDLTFKLI